MDKFHKNLNKMALFSTLILIVGVIFWRTFMNIAVSNIILNGIIIGVGIFGICLCFISMFRLLPEYKWMNAYFNGKVSGINPVLLRPVALVLNNKHTHITTSDLTELLDLVSLNMENERDYIRYITNTLIFLGLLGTFWGLIVTVGGFAELLTTLNFEDESVLTTMQMGMAKPLSGMATAFTSSLLGLGSSLIVGFLANQLQNAQNNIFQEITHFMSIYVVQTPNKKGYDVYSNAPVTQPVYTNISDIYDAFVHANYEIKDIVRIDGIHPALIALGTNEQLFIGTNDVPVDVLEKTIKHIELCFADTLEGIAIKIQVFSISNQHYNDNKIKTFRTTTALRTYLEEHKNKKPSSKSDLDAFDAYSDYITNVLEYLFKQQ